MLCSSFAFAIDNRTYEDSYLCIYGFLIYESFISSVDNNVHMWCLENEFRYGAFQLHGIDFRLNLSPGI